MYFVLWIWTCIFFLCFMTNMIFKDTACFICSDLMTIDTLLYPQTKQFKVIYSFIFKFVHFFPFCPGWSPNAHYSDSFFQEAHLLHWNGPFKPWNYPAVHVDLWEKWFIPDPSKKFSLIRPESDGWGLRSSTFTPFPEYLPSYITPNCPT